MKPLLMICLFSFSICLQANDSIKNSFCVKAGNANTDGLFFSVSYAYRFNNWLGISPSFIYANMLLGDKIYVIADGSGISGDPVYLNSRLSSALVADIQFSSSAFTSPGCRHRFMLGIGAGAVQYIQVRATYGWSDRIPPHFVSASTHVYSLQFGQHLSLSYSYRIGKRTELGIFVDFLKTPADFDWGTGLSCAVSF